MNQYKMCMGMWNSFSPLIHINISQEQQRDKKKKKRINLKTMNGETIKTFFRESNKLPKASVRWKWQEHSHNKFLILRHSNKQCTLYDLCQHKAVGLRNTSFTVHQILRKIQKTCTTYMQIFNNFRLLDLK